MRSPGQVLTWLIQGEPFNHPIPEAGKYSTKEATKETQIQIPMQYISQEPIQTFLHSPSPVRQHFQQQPTPALQNFLHSPSPVQQHFQQDFPPPAANQKPTHIPDDPQFTQQPPKSRDIPRWRFATAIAYNWDQDAQDIFGRDLNPSPNPLDWPLDLLSAIHLLTLRCKPSLHRRARKLLRETVRTREVCDGVVGSKMCAEDVMLVVALLEKEEGVEGEVEKTGINGGVGDMGDEKSEGVENKLWRSVSFAL